MSIAYEQPELSTESSVVTSSANQQSKAVTVATHPDAQRLTDLVFTCYALHAGMESPPRITKKALRDMDLLLRRGPAEARTPVPVEPERVERVIHGVFDMLAERRGSFCWADQIRSPGALRRHWVRVRKELNDRHKAQQSGHGPLSQEDRRAWIEVGLELNRQAAQS